MFVGDKKNPIAIGKKIELLANLDDEFNLLLDDAYNHLSGFKKISADDPELSEGYIVATRYLVLTLMKEYNTSVGF
jgi:hypothetical protein